MAGFTSPFSRLLFNTYDALGMWWVRYEFCLRVPDYISWSALQMTYCFMASPQPAVSQGGELMWQLTAAERRGFLCLSLIPIFVFSHTAQQSWPLLHELWFLLDTLASFCLTEPAKSYAFAEEMWLRVTFLPSEVSCWISGGCDQEAVVSATSLLDHRLTAEAVQLLAESPKNPLPGSGKQLMGFGVTVGLAEM